MDYEVVIPTTKKDYNKVPYILKSIEKYLNPKPKAINIIHSGEFTENLECCPFDRVSVIHEKEVLDLDPKLAKNFRRPEWIYQQFLKLFQDITETDDYLVVDSDCFINKPIELYDGTQYKFFLGIDQNHAPYFRYSEDMFGFGREYNHSFISEIMMFNKKITEILIDVFFVKSVGKHGLIYDVNDLRKHHRRLIMALYYITCDKACDDWIPADYEIYGNFVESSKYLQPFFKKVHIKTNLKGKYTSWTNEELEAYIKEMEQLGEHDIFTAHTWI